MEVSDYQHIEQEIAHYKDVCHRLQNSFTAQHEHRAWEYGLGLRVATKTSAKTALDVGGAGSPFAALCASQGVACRIIDFADFRENFNRQRLLISTKLMKLEQVDFFQYPIQPVFDVVSCISVLEHVPNHLEFFERLLTFVNLSGIVYLTFDYSPSGAVFWEDKAHLRTFNLTEIRKLIDIGNRCGFEVFGNIADYSFGGNNVFEYNFASLVLQRIK